MKIAANRMVSIHYTLKDEEGQELDSSHGADPLTYLHGGGLIPGLERELEGREAGETFQTTIQPVDAYGEVNPELIREVPLEAFSGIEELRVGMRLQSRTDDGTVHVFTVESIGDDTAVLNSNHLLAGFVLHFDVSVIDVREPGPDETSR